MTPCTHRHTAQGRGHHGSSASASAGGRRSRTRWRRCQASTGSRSSRRTSARAICPPPWSGCASAAPRVVPHGVSLGLGGADRPTAAAARGPGGAGRGAGRAAGHRAHRVRTGRRVLTASPQLEAGHLLPVPRTWDALDVLCENVRIAQDSLPVPLALENIAALISWPDEELTEGQFLAELVERTGVRLLIDVANLHTNHVNRGEDPAKALDELPVEAIAYVHVAGGVERDGVWHDTHAHPVTAAGPGRPGGAPLPGVPAGRPAGAGRRLPAGGGTGGGTDDDPRDGDGAAAARADGGRARRSPAATAPDAARAAAGTRRPEPAARPGTGAAPPATRRRARAGRAALRARRRHPRPRGFDSRRLRVQSRALAAKRADVVAKVAPELPEILGDGLPRRVPRVRQVPPHARRLPPRRARLRRAAAHRRASRGRRRPAPADPLVGGARRPAPAAACHPSRTRGPCRPRQEVSGDDPARRARLSRRRRLLRRADRPCVRPPGRPPPRRRPDPRRLRGRLPQRRPRPGRRLRARRAARGRPAGHRRPGHRLRTPRRSPTTPSSARCSSSWPPRRPARCTRCASR